MAPWSNSHLFYYHWPVFFENIQVMLHMWCNWSHTIDGLMIKNLDENQSVGAFNVTCLKGVIIGLGNGMWSSGVEAISNINVESSSHHGRYQRENGCAYNYVLWITILFWIDCINNITHALWRIESLYSVDNCWDVTTVSVLKRRVYGCLFNAQNLETHYSDVIIFAMASQITSLTIVYSIVYSDADQRKYQNSASLVFAWGIHRGPVNSQYKWPVTRRMFPIHDVIMACLWLFVQCAKLGNNSEWEADLCPHVAVRDGDELISDLLLAM